jgi:hypothetical protein
MTEAEWDTCTSPETMLTYLRATGRASERKLRLLVVAWLRSVWDCLRDPRSRHAVVVAERLAEGDVQQQELHAASYAAAAALTGREGEPDLSVEEAYAIGVIMWFAAAAIRPVAGATAFDLARRTAAPSLCHLLRELFGPLAFRPTPLTRSCLTWQCRTVPKLAQAIYDERQLPSGHLDTNRLAVLADALEEAGCTDAELLGHLRSPGPHTRGCWAVDLILQRE